VKSRAISLTTPLSLLAAAALLVGALPGCPLDEECDPDTDPDCVADAPDAGSGETRPYQFVLVEDLEEAGTLGVELDAVALIKGGTTIYADQAQECILGEGTTDKNDCNRALGPPDNATGQCTPSDDFYVNLGGTGGSLVVSFNGLTEINTGDQIRVYDCGFVPDEYRILVGTETSATAGNWVVCTPSASGIGECTVPDLPPVPQDGGRYAPSGRRPLR
jgi:hypothetical protein